MSKKPPKYVLDAIKCGPVPVFRDWQNMEPEDLKGGEKVLRFAADYLVFGEGKMIGKPLILDPFQQAFVLSAFDKDQHISKAMLSVARRNGKTLVLAAILLYLMFSTEGAPQNSLIRSAAMTREQAALLYRLMAQILHLSPDVDDGVHYRVVPSGKKIVALRRGVEYQALSRDAKSGHGQGLYALVVDECGQIDAPNDDFLDMLFSSMGTYSDSRVFMISTQACAAGIARWAMLSATPMTPR